MASPIPAERHDHWGLRAVVPHPQALAHYTDRNIISVPLSQIGTNQQLQDIVFDQSFKVAAPFRTCSALQLPCSLTREA